jgi:hypothetical protein
MKTHFKKVINPDFLGSWDLEADGGYVNRLVTIKEVGKREAFNGTKKEEVAVVLFHELPKPMVLNSENGKRLKTVIGSHYIEDWIGKQVILGVEKTKAFGEVVDALRFSKTKPTLPTLTADHPKFAAVKKAIETGTATMADARLKFVISAEVEQLLMGGGK